MTPEGLVKKRVKEILKELGAWYAMPMGTGYGHSGIPDFLVCLDGVFIAIETKAGKGTTTALQDREIKRIHEAKGIAIIVREDNLETLARDLKMMIRGRV
jgi:Holliday junction resolvase